MALWDSMMAPTIHFSLFKVVQVGNDKEIAQSERISHYINRGVRRN